jgi:hypothetical protein
MILGSLRKAMVQLNGGPLPQSADDIHDSVLSLGPQIFIILNGIICMERHHKCDPSESLKKLALDTVQHRGTAVNSGHLRYMKAQRQKIGLNGTRHTQGNRETKRKGEEEN